MMTTRILLLILFFAQPALASERIATFSVSNMTCALCPVTVESAISQVKGVSLVKVNKDIGQATVSYDDALATIDAIAAASTNAGYPATVVQAQ